MRVLTFNDFLNEAKSFKPGDVWEWHTVEWDPKRKNNYKVIKKVQIQGLNFNGDVLGRLEGSSETFIVKDADKYLKKKVG
jgi:hypothetical protein